MIVIEAVLMILVPCLLGEGVLRLLYGNQYRQKMTRADSVLTGWMIVIGLAEAAHLAAVISGRSFSDCLKIFLPGLAVCTMAAAVLLFVSGRQQKQNKADAREAERFKIKSMMTENPHRAQEQIIFLIFGILVLIQFALLETGGEIYPTGDMTVETVNTMLATDTLYQVNPMTGLPYVQGLPMRLKILCLPTLYAMLCKLFGMSAAELVRGLMPLITLIGGYLAYYTAAQAVFPGDRRKRGIFLVITALILWVGNYTYGMDGFGMQYAGFRGVSFRGLILLPYTFGLILRKKWRLLPLCILAEACILWTLYGMGACLFVTAAMLVTGLLRKRTLSLRRGEEAPV